MIFTTSTYIMSFIAGFALANFFRKIIVKINSEKLKIECTEHFKQISERIKSGKSSFFSRVNNTVIINTSTEKLAEINVIYLIDKKMLCIFRDNTCLYTSDSIDPVFKENIILHINIAYKKEIEDIIELFGVVISKKELHDKLEELRQKISKGEIKINESDESYIDKIIGQKEANVSETESFDIDQILDKISDVGIERLSSEEKEFLNNYNKK